LLLSDVGFHIGGDSNINYLVMQIHYVSALSEPDHSGLAIYTTQTEPRYQQGIFLMVSNTGVIPPNQKGRTQTTSQ
jgi:hypothetical protein